MNLAWRGTGAATAAEHTEGNGAQCNFEGANPGTGLLRRQTTCTLRKRIDSGHACIPVMKSAGIKRVR